MTLRALMLAELMMEAAAAGHSQRRLAIRRRSTPSSTIRTSGWGFVGSTPIAEYVYTRGCAAGKRVNASAAQEHMIIMPDADMDQAVNALIGAGYGSAGERCMAVSVAVPVGQKTADLLIERLIPRVENLKIGPSTSEDADFGPLVTKQHLQRVKDYVALGIEEGAKLLVDGRDFRLQGYENGFYMGGCLFDEVTPNMRIYKEEIFGPVLSVVRAKTYEEGLRLASDHEYGNGVAIFTRDGDTARDFAAKVNVGLTYRSRYRSLTTPSADGRPAFGDLNQHGRTAFASIPRRTVLRWPSGVKEGGVRDADNEVSIAAAAKRIFFRHERPEAARVISEPVGLKDLFSFSVLKTPR